jgi:hypothetical protein
MERLKDTLLAFFEQLDQLLTDSYPVKYKRQFNIVLKDIPDMINTLPNLEFSYITPTEGKEAIYNLVFESSRDYIAVYVGSKIRGYLTYSQVVLCPEVAYRRLEHDLFHAIRKIESLVTAGIVN